LQKRWLNLPHGFAMELEFPCLSELGLALAILLSFSF
jgi:hypothetical protein